MLQRIATFFFLFLIAILLIGQRFDFSWAGGQGYDYSVPVEVLEVVEVVEVDRAGMLRQIQTNDMVARGEIVKTGDTSRVLLGIEGLMLGLDERTDLKIEQLGEEQIQLNLIRGRVMLFKPNTKLKLVISTKNAQISVSQGLVSLVNYDFRETVGVMPVNTAVEVEIMDKKFVTENPLEIREVEPIDIQNITFDPSNSAAADFYQWFDERVPTDKPTDQQVVSQTPTD